MTETEWIEEHIKLVTVLIPLITAILGVFLRYMERKKRKRRELYNISRQLKKQKMEIKKLKEGLRKLKDATKTGMPMFFLKTTHETVGYLGTAPENENEASDGASISRPRSAQESPEGIVRETNSIITDHGENVN